ncbi:hypothetical protein AB4455_23000 [Vibrio sp. 10N.261.46.E12]|uniref:hypothetical protein n=1 Tax=unclassified Vibrio TaxID=2614977 RepID=UPI000975BAAC|nr:MULTISPECIES: hypothetical protein [unclassified Vibrio]OMO38440.1 hypothetical protein BH584_17720 [Vibrio sp. 10N.261.45.E1]PMJ36226.1 hypothetical protein BCU27_23580 [Vibrio sp. 10N.286.45.B6]PML84182.1 hypothetical protein BCT66_17915 [Vibrio sp. 10N.261.49.E11]PMM89297.1 hypothetical protein BCT46_25200 [Vibrio sp. 10N.261.46.E8]PMN44184.1 hypothetical protein BCT32_15715 [Vibrio sp. 10N.261.45.E11]
MEKSNMDGVVIEDWQDNTLLKKALITIPDGVKVKPMVGVGNAMIKWIVTEKPASFGYGSEQTLLSELDAATLTAQQACTEVYFIDGHGDIEETCQGYINHLLAN